MVIEHRAAVLLVCVATVAVAMPLAMRVGDHFVVAGQIRGSESALVEARLSDEFEGHNERVLALVVSGARNEGDTATLVRAIVGELERLAWIDGAESFFTGGDRSLFDAATGHAVVLARLGSEVSDSGALVRLRALTSTYTEQPRWSSIALDWTGDIPIREDIVTASNDDLRRSELRALPVSFFILCYAFGALVAAVLPVAIGVLSMLFTLAAARVFAEFMTVSIIAQSVASLLGLALGIDYALLMISQFRKELETVPDPREAAARASQRTAGTIVISGTAVAIGFAGLALVPVDQLRSIGLAGIAVPIFAALLSTTALPVVLSFLGRGVDWGRLWGRRSTSPSRHWYRWAGYVCAHPWRVVMLSAVPLALLASFARDMEGTFPSDSWLPARNESVKGLARLKEMGQVGAVNRVLILYELPDGVDAMQPAGRNALRQLHIHLNDDARTLSVLSAITFGLSSALPIGRAPDDLLNRYLSADRKTALFEVTPDAVIDTGGELTRFVRELRGLDLASMTGVGGRLHVGGLPAATADYEDVVDYWLPRVIALVALLSFLALALAFRSVLIPLKAVALNLLSVFAAYGAIVLIFIDGFGVGLFGLAGPVEGVFPPTPILVFCAAFGISMDYEVFLLSSIARTRREGATDRDAIVEGVARTGRLITSAAAIMIVVFGAFALSEILPTQILGTALAIVVALDALLIRIALGPAVINLIGRWNWWPG